MPPWYFGSFTKHPGRACVRVVAVMRTRVIANAVLALAAVAVGWPATSRSIWDGVFTTAQAQRGKPHYDRQCADCHGQELEGDAEAPALSGGDFLWKWNGLTLDQMFERVHRDMPLNNARTLSRDVAAELLAYMLRVNGLPAGKTELPHDPEVLKQIRIEAVKP
jgi:mono/diheme cytochrome c family protein